VSWETRNLGAGISTAATMLPRWSYTGEDDVAALQEFADPVFGLRGQEHLHGGTEGFVVAGAQGGEVFDLVPAGDLERAGLALRWVHAGCMFRDMDTEKLPGSVIRGASWCALRLRGYLSQAATCSGCASTHFLAAASGFMPFWMSVATESWSALVQLKALASFAAGEPLSANFLEMILFKM